MNNLIIIYVRENMYILPFFVITGTGRVGHTGHGYAFLGRYTSQQTCVGRRRESPFGS